MGLAICTSSRKVWNNRVQVLRSRSRRSCRGSMLARKGSCDRVVGEDSRSVRLGPASYFPSNTLQERIVSIVSRLKSEPCVWYTGLLLKVVHPLSPAAEACLIVSSALLFRRAGPESSLCFCCRCRCCCCRSDSIWSKRWIINTLAGSNLHQPLALERKAPTEILNSGSVH